MLTFSDEVLTTNLLFSSPNSIFSAITSLELFIPYVCISIFSLFSSYHLCNKSLSLFMITLGIFIPSRISSFAFNIFSLDPKFPICDVPILVITAKVGFAIFVNKLISPK